MRMDDSPRDDHALPTVSSRPIRLRERAGRLSPTAVKHAAGTGDAYHGAGSLFYVGRFELIEFAVVLEPEEPLRIAQKDFLRRHECGGRCAGRCSRRRKRAIQFRYPGSLYFDGRAGRRCGRLGVPAGANARTDAAPEWLVFGAMVRAGGMRELGVGMDADSMSPEITTLDDEGFEAWNPAGVCTASFARNFLVWRSIPGVSVACAEIGPNYLSRLEKSKTETRRGIDEDGDLLVLRGWKRDGARRVSLAGGLKRVRVVRSAAQRAAGLIMADLELLRTIRLDPSDGFVFTRAAEPGEWADPRHIPVLGAAGGNLDRQGTRTAFRSGLLGVTEFWLVDTRNRDRRGQRG